MVQALIQNYALWEVNELMHKKNFDSTINVFFILLTHQTRYFIFTFHFVENKYELIMKIIMCHV